MGPLLGASAWDAAKASTVFLESFLPAFCIVNQSAEFIAPAERLRAIQFAADASLAMSGTGACWSDSLCEKLSSSGEGGRDSEAASLADERRDEVGCPESRTESASSMLMRSYRKLFTRRAGGAPSQARGSALGCCERVPSRGGIRRGLITKARRSSHTARRPRPQSLRQLRAQVRSRNRRCEEERSLRNRYSALQKLLPGGASLDAASLLEETANFVVCLQSQLRAMQAVSDALEPRGSNECWRE